MRISLADRLGLGNAAALENAGRDAVRRQLEDEAIDRLVAALSRHAAARPAEPQGASSRFPQQSQKAG